MIQDKVAKPLWQFIYCLGGSILVTLVFWLLVNLNFMENSPKFYWMCATAFLLLYSIFNSLISLTAPNSGKYWSRSIMMFALLAIIAGALAYLFSGISVYDAGSYSFIYFVITFGYLVFISIMGFVKKIVAFAQKEVWNQPRLRKRK